ncbi:MAG: SDR family oxidoreductase [Rhodobacteraceae bacterium]|nr:SDR family oxidoreductase [Paracoccaceae bacterium]
MFDLKGQVALVTGASRGIGAEAAKSLAKHGASVVLAARSTDALETVADSIRSDGGGAEVVACDVSNYGSIRDAVTVCTAAFDRIDILVNNAGVIEPIARLEESDPDEWAKAIDINVKGVYNGMRAVIPIMLSQDSGTIINISSGAATSALEGWSHYCASKAAVLSLTKCAHLELVGKGLRVMGLSPGTVATGMQVAIKQSGINPVSELDPSVHIPASWVGETIAWLSTEAGNAYRGIDCSLRDEGVRRAVGLI